MFLYYLVNEKNEKHYLGLTNNLSRRIEEHNKENKHFTGKIKGVWKLVAFKKFNDGNFARKEEKRLKKAKNKKYIEWYFKNKRL
jgi:predicted GIY-YIG superfamily endonuclease